MTSHASCIFCKIIKGDIPCLKLFETKYSLAFLDIQPISKGHSLVIPKYHGVKLHDIPDEYLSDLLPTAKRVAQGLGLAGGLNSTLDGDGYNILQNNSTIAHQVVDHVHVHVIPKRVDHPDLGLVIGWPEYKTNQDELKQLQREITDKIANI